MDVEISSKNLPIISIWLSNKTVFLIVSLKYSFESEQEEFYEEPNENNDVEKNNEKNQKRKRRTRFFAYPSSPVMNDRNLAIVKAAKKSNGLFDTIYTLYLTRFLVLNQLFVYIFCR